MHLTAWRRNGPEIFDAVNSVSADVYVFTGDQIFKESGIDAFWEWFDRFGGKLNPCVMILGNAENKPNVRTSLFEEQAINRDIPLLNNMTTLLRLGDSNLQIVGTNDPHTFRSHIQSAYDNADPDLWTLLLIHSPDGVSELNGRRADLILCGHTHGGQICLPGIGPLGQNTRRVRGLVVGWYSGEELKRKAGCELGEAKLYVCRGLGMSRIALRSGCRPELALFELRRKD